MNELARHNPAFMELLKRAAQDEVTLRFTEKRRAEACRFRIYALRKRMKKQGHELSDIAERVEIRIIEDNDPKAEKPWLLIAGPGGFDFEEELAEAGISITDSVPSLEDL